MLSHDDQVEGIEEDSESEERRREGESESEELYFEHRGRIEEVEVGLGATFVEQLGLNELIGMKRPPNNTKNVLRNFGNAQNQYILYHKDAKTHIKESLVHPAKFVEWVR